MTDILAGAMAIMGMIVLAIAGFILKREREFGQIHATLKAEHQRIDRIEKTINGGME